MNKSSCLFLNKVFIILKDSKSFKFLSKKIYPHITVVIINKTYEVPLLIAGNKFDGSQKSTCTNYSFCNAFHELLIEIASLCCFPTVQSMHVLDGAFNCGNRLTICLYCNILRLLKLKCPYLQCHKWLLFSRVV
jgi:hypothetical protein